MYFMALVLWKIFIIFFIFFKENPALPYTEPHPAEIKAVYLGTNNIYNKKKIQELERIIATTTANGIVIDFKDSNAPNSAHMQYLVERFRGVGAYTIARIVTFQDSSFAQKHPDIAIKTRTGELWYSGRRVWKRYWIDPASPLAQEYTISIAKMAIDVGFHEVQFDYIRFPTDGNMRDIIFPVFDPVTDSKIEIMHRFFARLKKELKAYSPSTILGIDIFGEVFMYGKVAGIGQTLESAAESFDVLSPMAYPSHYMCGEFKVKDPNAHPYLVYQKTLGNGIRFLAGRGVIIRPWIQSFTLRNIYGCGPKIAYGTKEVNAQIRATEDLHIRGFMLWNVANVYPAGIFQFE